MSSLRNLCALTMIAVSLCGGEPPSFLGSAILRGTATLNDKPISGPAASLGDNDRLRTGASSGAILTVAKGDTIVAGENTSIVLTRTPDGTVARIESGVATVSTRRERLQAFQAGGDFSIRTASGTGSLYKIAKLGSTTYVLPAKGEVSIEGPNGSAVGVAEGMMGVVGDSAAVERYVQRAALEMPQQSGAPQASNATQGNKKAGQLSAVIPAGYIVRGTSRSNGAAGAPVYINDLLKTTGRGRMRFNLDDGSIVNVGPNSQFQVKEQDAQSQQTAVEMLYGKMRAQVSKRTNASGKFEIRTATAICGVIGTDLYVESTQRQTKIVVFDGIVRVTSLATGVAVFTLAAGQTGTVSLGGAAAQAAASAGQLQAAASSTQISGVGAATTAGGVAAGTNIAIVSAVLVPPAIAAAVAVPLLTQEEISPTQP